MSSLKLIKIIKGLLYCLAFTPLVITPMTIFPFNFGRGLIIQFLIEIIFGLYLILAIFDKNYRPRRSGLTMTLGIFLLLLFISSVFGVHFRKSFWGAEERFTAWFYLLHAFLFYLAATSVFKTKKDWLKFFGANVIAANLVFGVALLSLFGVKFWGVDLGTRISGTLGNPIFLAAYLILNLGLALYLFFAGSGWKKIVWFILAFFLAAGVILAQSRGAFLGLLAGCFAGLSFYIFKNKNRMARILALIFLSIVIFAIALLFIFRDTAFVKRSAVLNRLASTAQAGTGSTRLMNWSMAWEGIRERPVLGWGMEGFDVVFNKYYQPKLLKYSYYETWSDKPHNKILEAAVDGGVIGLASYLSIFGAAIFLIFKKLSRNKISLPQAAALGGGLVAYFAQNLFAFDTPVSYLLFFALLAFINFKESEDYRTPFKIPFFAAGFAIVIMLAAGYLNFSPFFASVNLRNAVPIEDMGKKVNLGRYRSAMQIFNPYRQEWRDELAKSVLASLKRGDNMYVGEEIVFALREAEAGVKDEPNSAYNHMLLGGLYAELALDNKEYYDISLKEFSAAMKFSPRRQHILFALGRLYGVTGNKDKLIETFERAIALEPQAGISSWEAAKQLYLLDKENPLVKEWLIKMAEAHYYPVDNQEFLFVFKKIHEAALKEKAYGILSALYKRMGLIEPTEAKWHAQRAMALYLMKDNNNAVLEIRQAVELDESYREEGEEFIRLIQANK